MNFSLRMPDFYSRLGCKKWCVCQAKTIFHFQNPVLLIACVFRFQLQFMHMKLKASAKRIAPPEAAWKVKMKNPMTLNWLTTYICIERAWCWNWDELNFDLLFTLTWYRQWQIWTHQSLVSNHSDVSHRHPAIRDEIHLDGDIPSAR